MLSNLIILLNSFFVIPIDLSIANSFFLKFIFVVIVLKMFVIPIKVITPINPYKNIEITNTTAFSALTDSSKLNEFKLESVRLLSFLYCSTSASNLSASFDCAHKVADMYPVLFIKSSLTIKYALVLYKFSTPFGLSSVLATILMLYSLSFIFPVTVSPFFQVYMLP